MQPRRTRRRTRPGRPGDCSPGLPQIRTCPTKASGSSRHGFTSRFAIGERYVDPRPRYKALDGWPAHQSMTNLFLPSPGSPRSRFPCFNGTMKRCDSLRPSRRASCCFAWQYQALRLCFAPCGPERLTAGREFVIRSPLPESCTWRRSGSPKFLGSLAVPMPCSSTPAGPDTPGHKVRRYSPRAVHAEGSRG